MAPLAKVSIAARPVMVELGRLLPGRREEQHISISRSLITALIASTLPNVNIGQEN